MTDTFPIASATCHDELVDGLRLRKDALGLSDAFVEDIGMLTGGHANKLLGPTREKNLSKFSLDVLMKVLAVRIVIVPDADQEKRMELRWERREGNRVHVSKNRISKTAIERAKPVIMRKFSQLGNAARNRMLPAEHRIKIARKAARARWRKPRIREIEMVR